jgi:hypothetical protein
LGDSVRNLPAEENLTHILTHISGKTCRNGSRVGEIEPLEKADKTALHAASRLELSQSGDSETLVEVAGIEPAGAGESTPVKMRASANLPEALIKILTNLPDSDRRMLSQIVERYDGGQGGTGLSRKGEVRGSKDAGPVSQPAKTVVA